MTAHYRQPWMQQPETFTTQMSHDGETLTFELPNGSVVQLSYREMRELITTIESYRLAE